MTEHNMNQDKSNSHLADNVAEDIAEGIKAKQIADLLNGHAQHLSMRTLKQLENGREQAVKAHMQQVGSINRDGTISGMVNWAEHHRIATTSMLLAAIITGFVLTQSFSQNIEHGDAFLLGAELPPEAFVDTAFEPSLNTAHAKL